MLLTDYTTFTLPSPQAGVSILFKTQKTTLALNCTVTSYIKVAKIVVLFLSSLHVKLLTIMVVDFMLAFDNKRDPGCSPGEIRARQLVH